VLSVVCVVCIVYVLCVACVVSGVSCAFVCCVRAVYVLRVLCVRCAYVRICLYFSVRVCLSVCVFVYAPPRTKYRGEFLYTIVVDI